MHAGDPLLAERTYVIRLYVSADERRVMQGSVDWQNLPIRIFVFITYLRFSMDLFGIKGRDDNYFLDILNLR